MQSPHIYHLVLKNDEAAWAGLPEKFRCSHILAALYAYQPPDERSSPTPLDSDDGLTGSVGRIQRCWYSEPVATEALGQPRVRFSPPFELVRTQTLKHDERTQYYLMFFDAGQGNQLLSSPARHISKASRSLDGEEVVAQEPPTVDLGSGFSSGAVVGVGWGETSTASGEAVLSTTLKNLFSSASSTALGLGTGPFQPRSSIVPKVSLTFIRESELASSELGANQLSSTTYSKPSTASVQPPGGITELMDADDSQSKPEPLAQAEPTPDVSTMKPVSSASVGEHLNLSDEKEAPKSPCVIHFPPPIELSGPLLEEVMLTLAILRGEVKSSSRGPVSAESQPVELTSHVPLPSQVESSQGEEATSAVENLASASKSMHAVDQAPPPLESTSLAQQDALRLHYVQLNNSIESAQAVLYTQLREQIQQLCEPEIQDLQERVSETASHEHVPIPPVDFYFSSFITVLKLSAKERENDTYARVQLEQEVSKSKAILPVGIFAKLEEVVGSRLNSKMAKVSQLQSLAPQMPESQSALSQSAAQYIVLEQLKLRVQEALASVSIEPITLTARLRPANERNGSPTKRGLTKDRCGAYLQAPSTTKSRLPFFRCLHCGGGPDYIVTGWSHGKLVRLAHENAGADQSRPCPDYLTVSASALDGSDASFWYMNEAQLQAKAAEGGVVDPDSEGLTKEELLRETIYACQIALGLAKSQIADLETQNQSLTSFVTTFEGNQSSSACNPYRIVADTGLKLQQARREIQQLTRKLAEAESAKEEAIMHAEKLRERVRQLEHTVLDRPALHALSEEVEKDQVTSSPISEELCQLRAECLQLRMQLSAARAERDARLLATSPIVEDYAQSVLQLKQEKKMFEEQLAQARRATSESHVETARQLAHAQQRISELEAEVNSLRSKELKNIMTITSMKQALASASASASARALMASPTVPRLSLSTPTAPLTQNTPKPRPSTTPRASLLTQPSVPSSSVARPSASQPRTPRAPSAASVSRPSSSKPLVGQPATRRETHIQTTEQRSTQRPASSSARKSMGATPSSSAKTKDTMLRSHSRRSLTRPMSSTSPAKRQTRETVRSTERAREERASDVSVAIMSELPEGQLERSLSSTPPQPLPRVSKPLDMLTTTSGSPNGSLDGVELSAAVTTISQPNFDDLAEEGPPSLMSYGESDAEAGYPAQTEEGGPSRDESTESSTTPDTGSVEPNFLRCVAPPYPLISDGDVAVLRQAGEETAQDQPTRQLCSLMELLEESESSSEPLLAASLSELEQETRQEIHAMIRVDSPVSPTQHAPLLSLTRTLPKYVQTFVKALTEAHADPLRLLCGIQLERISGTYDSRMWISEHALSEAWVDAESRHLLTANPVRYAVTEFKLSDSVQPDSSQSLGSLAGLWIESVLKNSSAHQLGIQPQTLLTHIGGLPVTSALSASKILLDIIADRLLFVPIIATHGLRFTATTVEMTFAYLRNVSNLFHPAQSSPSNASRSPPPSPSVHTPGLIVRTIQVPLALITPTEQSDAAEVERLVAAFKAQLPEDLVHLQQNELLSRTHAASALAKATWKRLLPHIVSSMQALSP